MVQILDILLKDDLHPSLAINANNQLQVNVDNESIHIKPNGTIALSFESQLLINAIKANQTLTALSSRVDAESGARFITYVNELGQTTELNFSAFMTDVHVNGGVVEGKVLVLTDTAGDQVRIDLTQFMSDADVRSLIKSMFTVALRNLKGDIKGWILPYEPEQPDIVSE